MRDFPQSILRMSPKPLATDAGAAFAQHGKQVFESPQGILRVTNLIAIAKKIHKIFIFVNVKAHFRSGRFHYAGKWLANRCFSRFLFQGNSRRNIMGFVDEYSA
jgi:glutathione synthase/RimK-type ligase-like ATP-grasp enzyme